jgi:hypothetical protein
VECSARLGAGSAAAWTHVNIPCIFTGSFADAQAVALYSRRFSCELPQSADTYVYCRELSVFRIAAQRWMFVVEAGYRGYLPPKGGLFFSDGNILDQSCAFGVYDLDKESLARTVGNNCNFDIGPLLDRERHFFRSRIGDFPAMLVNHDASTVRIFVPASYARAFECFLS